MRAGSQPQINQNTPQINQNLPNQMLMAGLQAKEDKKIRSSLSRSWQDLASASKVIMMNIAKQNIIIVVAKSFITAS